MATAPSEAPQTFDPQAFDRDEEDTIFLLTSLTSGSSSIITATSRLEHILKSNKVPFKAVDLATDDKARRLWQWKGKGKRLPGIAKNGNVLGNFEDIEEWNEYGELRQNLGLKKRKKKINVMDGDTAHSKPSRTATPNVVQPKAPKSDLPAGGVPTAIAQAAAAAGRRKAVGIKSAVDKAEGKKRKPKKKTEGEAAAEPKAEKTAETKAERPAEPEAAKAPEEETKAAAPQAENKEEEPKAALPEAENKEEAPVPEKKDEEAKIEEFESKAEEAVPETKEKATPTEAKSVESAEKKPDEAPTEEAAVSELKSNVEALDLQDKNEALVPGDEESKTPTQTPATKEGEEEK